ncbi:hypothetical protein Moror_14180 [Moniliophthora roreri MCA 2997]|uniref:Hyaluronan/mRNA-binding protein domain-containing protein n=1 Tax=Moniliophthora roreri (strain MCA 2997) TaxID=1381753 RepID=V2XM21_MONRO|nr:hypothetical protein Moror_14180 [Moniliophthora roreri MCA 2997]
MTRTERSAYPRAVLRDRSLSRSGLEKGFRKEGGGAHNWGRLDDELEHEFAALDDENLELEEEAMAASASSADSEKAPPLSPNSSMTEAEIEAAKQFRKNAFKKGQVDLAAIARTSNAVSTSPPKVTPASASAASDTASNASA